MATSSCDKFSTEFGELTLQPSVNEDSDDGECSLRSPNVRAYIASFELQHHRHHRLLCRTDDVGRYQHRYHQRPQPPCKTTSAVLKARHLRAASEDFSTTSWKSTDHSEGAVTGRSVAELKVALLNSANPSSDQNGRSEDDITVEEPTSRCHEQNVTVASECDDNAVDERSWIGTEHDVVHSSMTMVPDTAVDCSLHHSTGKVDPDEQQSPTDGGVDAVDSTGDDVGYFSLRARRPDRNSHQTARQSWHLRNNSSTVNNVEVDPPLADSSDSAGSISPALRTSGDHCNQADVSSFGNCASEDEHCQNHYEASQYHVDESSITTSGCSDAVIPDNSPSRSECTAYDQHSDEMTAEEDDQEIAVEDDPVDPWRNSVPLAKIEPERLSEMMMSSFGRCDEVLCRAVGASNSYRTALSYVSNLYAESRLIQQCAFDLSRPCQLDVASTGIQFLTLEAVRVSFVFLMHNSSDNKTSIQMYHRSGTGVRCCISAQHSVEIMTSNGKSDQSTDEYLHEKHSCQISSRSDLKRRSLILF